MFVICFIIDEKIKQWPLHFPVRENPNKKEALINWPIVLRYDVKAKYRLISRKFFGHEVFSPERSLNRPKATRVCIRSINHSNRSFFVRLFFSVLFTRFRVKVIRKSLHPFMSPRKVIRHCVHYITNQARNQGGCTGCVRTLPTGPKGPHFDTQYPS